MITTEEERRERAEMVERTQRKIEALAVERLGGSFQFISDLARAIRERKEAYTTVAAWFDAAERALESGDDSDIMTDVVKAAFKILPERVRDCYVERLSVIAQELALIEGALCAGDVGWYKKHTEMLGEV